MGIGSSDLDLLIRLRGAGFLEAPCAIIEIGAQQLSNHFFDDERLGELARLFGADPDGIPGLGKAASDRRGAQDLPADAPLAREFWEWLGLRYAAIDIDGSPHSIPLDLNYDRAPKAARGVYGLVTNFGTTEHVTNQLNAFEIIHDLTMPGGVMIHNLPTQGNASHGLFNYNMKFFWMLARSNEYEWLFLDYHHDGDCYGLRQDMIDAVAHYAPDIAGRATDISLSDDSILVAFRKVRDFAFVAPLDVNNGAKAPNAAIAERYWTVFGGEPPKQGSWLTRVWRKS
jgi:hypothetical protein